MIAPVTCRRCRLIVLCAFFSQDNAQGVLQKLIIHFQTLFDVKELEGVLPKMNELYLFVNEALNHMRALRSMLGFGLCC